MKHGLIFALAISMKTNTMIYFLLLSILMTSCIPQMEKADGTTSDAIQTSASIDSINQQLVKTSTGSQTINDMNNLKNSGYVMQIQLVSTSEIQNMNGHTGGGYRILGNSITVYLNNTLTTEEQAHALAHEIVHIKDDFVVQQFMNQYSYVKSNAEDFVAKYKTTNLSSFDQRVVNYVLGTLFCTETRAYTINQQLYNEGLNTVNFAKGSGLPQFIDQNYIYRFGTQYGQNASAMASWCLNKNSMNSIQSGLIW